MVTFGEIRTLGVFNIVSVELLVMWILPVIPKEFGLVSVVLTLYTTSGPGAQQFTALNKT
jgi:hypothetical protein